jgi:hypothetical protein
MAKNQEHSVPQPSQQQDIKFRFAPDFKRIYANYVQAGFTFFDVTLLLGENVAIDNQGVQVEVKSTVTVAPSEAKILYRILANTLKEYERQFGPIVVPDVIMPPEQS